MPFTLSGTMASGDPFTTLGNTLRSLLYYKYATRNIVPKPFVMAAGDDVILLPQDFVSAESIRNAVLAHTSLDNATPSPLG